jgi:adenosylcobinamide-GDP ribazoletransferase
MAGMMRGLWAALGFLTRLPLPRHDAADATARAASLAWYPAVGLLIGVLLCAVSWLFDGAPSLLVAAVVLATWVWSTGGLHLDGLADSADAWVGGLGDRERTLAIMKDPRCGPAGVVALAMVLLLKFAALASLPAVHGYALLLAPALARAGLTALFLWMPYVRREGLGTPLTMAPRRACLFALGATAAASLCFGRPGLVAIGVAAIVWFAWRRACMERLHGFTGDTAGALAEMTEVAVLLALTIAG